MKKIPLIALLLITAGMTACSSKQVYDGMKMRNEIDCRKLPDSQYQECMDAQKKDYETYKQERGEATRDRY